MYLEQMKKVVSLELDKSEYFNNYEFSEDDSMFTINVPLTIAEFNFHILVVLTDRMEVRVAGVISENIFKQHTEEIKKLMEFFNDNYGEENLTYTFDDTYILCCEIWESSFYHVDDDEYDAKSDLKNLRETITIASIATLAPVASALRYIVSKNMTAEEAFIAIQQDN